MRRLNQRLAFMALVILCVGVPLLFFTSCASFKAAQEKPFSEWSSKKKLTFTANVYADEYDKYMKAAVRPDLTDGEKRYLRDKRKALVALDQTLQALILIVDQGGTVGPQLEAQLLEQLAFFGIELL